jgi:hypothetical protein
MVPPLQPINKMTKHRMASHDISKNKMARTVPRLPVMSTVFCDAEGSILIDFLPKGETINAACYVHMLKKLRYALCEKHLMKKDYHPST